VEENGTDRSENERITVVSKFIIISLLLFKFPICLIKA